MLCASREVSLLLTHLTCTKISCIHLALLLKCDCCILAVSGLKRGFDDFGSRNDFGRDRRDNFNMSGGDGRGMFPMNPGLEKFLRLFIQYAYTKWTCSVTKYLCHFVAH